MPTPIPGFFLYGEPPRDVAADFLHMEDLDERSRPSHWNIRPHAHAALAHVFLITEGGGRMAADGAQADFAAPALVLIPVRAVHSFTWQPDTKGRVLTLSATLLNRLMAAAPELATLFRAPRHVALPPGGIDTEWVSHLCARIARELIPTGREISGSALPPAGGGLCPPAPPTGVPPASLSLRGTLPVPRSESDAGGTPVEVQGVKPPVAEGNAEASRSMPVGLAWSPQARDRALQACLTLLLTDALRLHLAAGVTAGPPPGARARLAARFAAAVEHEFQAPRAISAYAASLGAAPAALRAALRATTGRPPSALLRERQMLEARRLLLYSNVSIAEAAYAVGFEDPAYFSRVFRQTVGSSPRAFRQAGDASRRT